MPEQSPKKETAPELAPPLVATEAEQAEMTRAFITCPKCTQEWLRGKRGLSAGSGVTYPPGEVTEQEATFRRRAFLMGLAGVAAFGRRAHNSPHRGCEEHAGIF